MPINMQSFSSVSQSLWNKQSRILMIKIKTDGDIIDHNAAFTSVYGGFSNLFELITLTHLADFKKQMKKCLADSSASSFITNFCVDKNDVEDIPRSYFITMEACEGMVQLIAEPQNNLSHADTKAYFSMVNDLSNLNRKILKSEYRLHQANKKLNQQLKRVEYLANHDMLTGMFNRRRIFEQLSAELERCQRTGSTFCILMTDIDFFKKVNDNYGHQNGDRVLQHFAQIIKENIRPYDFAGRFGGEEFILIFPNTKIKDSLNIANRLLNKTINSQVKLQGYPEISISFSGGLAQITPGMAIDAIVELADQRLYYAKEQGRKRIIDKCMH